MASTRKNRAASPRAKAGIGAARAVSQAQSLPETVTAVEDAMVDNRVDETIVDEATATEPVTESVIEIVTDFEPALLVDELDPIESIGDLPIVEGTTPTAEDIIEAEEIIEAEIEASSNSSISEEIVAKSTAASAPRNKSKVSNSTSSVQRPKGDKTMTQETEKSAPLATKKEASIAKTGSALPVRPVAPGELTVVGMISSAGERPIGAATMVVFGTYMNGRPIEASNMKLFEILPGDRPVFSSEIAYVPGTASYGSRPIMISPAGLLGAEEVMGNRPIFSNDIVDPDSSSLMGYLD